MEESKPSQDVYIASRKRWIIISLYAALSIANASLWTTYSPISDLSQDYFGGGTSISGSITAINMLATTYQILYGPGTWLAADVMKMRGIRYTNLLAGLITAVGALIRLLAALAAPVLGNGGNYGFQLLGECLAALAQPLFLNLVTAIASSWFPVQERDLATTLATLCNPLGSAIGQIIPTLLVYRASDGSVHGMEMLLLVEVLMCGLPLVLSYFYFDAAPPTPPSRSIFLKATGAMNVNDIENIEENDRHGHSDSSSSNINSDHHASSQSESFQLNERLLISPISDQIKDSTITNFHQEQHPQSYQQSQQHSPTQQTTYHKLYQELRLLFHSRDYVLLFVSFSMGNGLFNALITLLNQILNAQGYSNDDAGAFGAVLIVSGVVGAGVTGYLMERTRAYRPILKIIFGLLVASFIFYFFMLKPGNYDLLLVSFALLGFFILGLLPVAVENAAEVAYPVDEEMSVGLLFLGGNTIGIGYVFGLQALIVSADSTEQNNLPWLPSNIFLFSFAFICFLLVLLYKGKYHRLEHEDSHVLSSSSHS